MRAAEMFAIASRKDADGAVKLKEQKIQELEVEMREKKSDFALELAKA